MTASRLLRAVLCSCVALSVLPGCNEVKLPPPPPPTKVATKFVASADVNPNDQGQASPIVLHVFELSALGKFQGADFFSLIESADATLGSDKLSHQEIQLVPGGEGQFAKTITNNAGHIGIIASYRNINGVQWRTGFSVPSNQTTRKTVLVGRQGLSVQ